eukprot:3160261-Pyramimonas_sp.AAC.1
MFLEHKPDMLKQDSPGQKCAKNISWNIVWWGYRRAGTLRHCLNLCACIPGQARRAYTTLQGPGWA